MIWNTIAHPKMMTQVPGAGESVVSATGEGIAYADPHKLAFFDLLIDASDENNLKLIHGDFETVKNKILNHELVIGGEITHNISPDGDTSSVGIMIGDDIDYAKNANKILFEILIPSGSFMYVISSDNTVSTYNDTHD